MASPAQSDVKEKSQQHSQINHYAQPMKNQTSSSGPNCIFTNSLDVAVTLLFGNNTTAIVPANNTYTMNVSTWASLGVTASDPSGEYLSSPKNEVTIGNFGYDIEVYIRATHIQKTMDCPLFPDQSHCTINITKVPPTLSMILDLRADTEQKSESKK